MKLIALALAAAVLPAQTPGTFELLGRYRGLGGLVASVVGPGPDEGSERFYLSYLYLSNTIDVVAVDPRTGEHQVFSNPAKGEYGARCMVAGPDGNLYLGTLPAAHFLKLDVKAGRLLDLGRPSGTESYIWDVAFGADGKLYGATYPQSKLVRYDPATGKLEDLGRMDPKEQYAHYVAGSDDGFMYVGIGTSRANIAAYEIRTGERRSVLPEDAQTVGQARVYRGVDGQVYGYIGSRYFRLSEWTAMEIPSRQAAPAGPLNRLSDGSTVSVGNGAVTVTGPKGEKRERPYEYRGNELALFRIGFGPDGELYGSAVLPIHLVKLDREHSDLRYMGDLGGGEIYSFLSWKDKLLMAGYSAYSPLMIFDPAIPFHQGAGSKNPVLVNFAGSDSGWRPEAFIAGPGGKVYLGAVAGYGKLGGPLTTWDVEEGKVEQFHHLIPDQSVISLAQWEDKLVGGTTIGGGGGSFATEKEAKIFLWIPETRHKEFETVPVPGATSVYDLITAPNGMVYGIAGGSMFVFDPASRTVTDRKPAPFRSVIYNAVALGPDGRIWGLSRDGVFAIDTAANSIEMVAAAPEAISGGFALRDGAIYFLSSAAVYRYWLPR